MDVSDRTDGTDDSYIPRKTANTLICGFGSRPIKEEGEAAAAQAKEMTGDEVLLKLDNNRDNDDDDDDYSDDDDNESTNSSVISICSEDAIVILDEDAFVCGNVHRAETADYNDGIKPSIPMELNIELDNLSLKQFQPQQPQSPPQDIPPTTLLIPQSNHRTTTSNNTNEILSDSATVGNMRSILRSASNDNYPLAATTNNTAISNSSKRVSLSTADSDYHRSRLAAPPAAEEGNSALIGKSWGWGQIRDEFHNNRGVRFAGSGSGGGGGGAAVDRRATPPDRRSRLSSGLNLSSLLESDNLTDSASTANLSGAASIVQHSYNNHHRATGEHMINIDEVEGMVTQPLHYNGAMYNINNYMPQHNNSMKQSNRGHDVGRRAIVSRETDIEYIKVVIPKSESVKTLIRDAIAANILFKACSAEELTELVEVFAPTETSAGCAIIREGDEGDAFYVMEKGTIDVYVGDAHKATLYSGASFGEIALLYNCPRSATIRSRYFCSLWTISRTAFRAITSQFKQRRQEAKCEFIKKVKIKDKYFSDLLSDDEINSLAIATINESYDPGHVIVREGDPGDIFYMIDSGCVDVYIKANGESKPVSTLTSGQFFGELALLSNDARTASCVAKTKVNCLILMRDDFNLLLGDLQSLMDGGDYRKKEEEESSKTKKVARASIQVQLTDLDILHVLGTGAFGRVRLVKLKHTIPGIKNVDDEYFALKCMSKKCIKENSLETHLQNEKSIMASLDHPFINRYYCDMEDDDNLYFLLEALPGGELCKRLRQEKRFPEAWGKFYSASVLFALCHLHSKKIAYRDLKPENLVMDSTGYVKVVDFGLAKVITGGKTWTLCGTPAYLAPEIVLNDGHDWSVDYWALGVFLFEMTSGKEPFAASNPMEVYKQIVSGYVVIPASFSSFLEDLIRKLLNTSKSKRLGRTMGGGGAVMQHNWYGDFDWDAHVKKRLAAPLPPLVLGGSVNSASASDSKSSSPNPSSKYDSGTASSTPPPRMTYALGRGNRHQQKLLEMMSEGGINVQPEQQVDNVRMTMMHVMKQHEQWSRKASNGESSYNSSTRNTSLHVASRRSRRASLETEGGYSTASSGGFENDAFLRLQAMHLNLASNCLTQMLEQDQAFQQFSLISLCSASFKKENPDTISSGNRFLDPFVTKRFELLDQYASEHSSSDLDSEALAAFCFPNGLRLRIIPRCAIAGASRLGWLGETGDRYQIQGFTDVGGTLSHGCAITIREVINSSDAPEITSILHHQRKLRRSARFVAEWWIKRKRHHSLQPSFVKKRNSWFGLRKSLRRNASKNSIDDSVEEEECNDTPPLPSHIQLLAQSSHKAMIDAEKEGDVCIIEKCYVLTGTRLLDQSLLFHALQNVINMERYVNAKSTRRSINRRYSFDKDTRHAVLSTLQAKLSLSESQRRIKYPRSELAFITHPPRYFVMDLEVEGFPEISMPLPLPEVSGHWGLSTLFIRIKDSGLIILLKLLLLERSVLVVGETPEEVTACTTALLELLEPYKWASAFMPLLPRDMIDFVSSPVPFIAGMIVESKDQLHSIVHDHGVKDSMLNGLSIVNLVSGKLIVTREKGTSDMLRRSFQPIPELAYYQKRIEEYYNYPKSNLRSFHTFVRYGASRSEILTLRKIKEVIRKILSQFTAGLTDRPDSWQAFGEFNEGAFDFSPDKYIQPLKDRMIFQIQFQEMMAHTQLFVGYVEELQQSHEKRKDLLLGPAAKFIARWIEYRLHCRKRQHGGFLFWRASKEESRRASQEGEILANKLTKC